MSGSVRARINWIPAELGGREKPPPGPQYSTVVRFADEAAKWPSVAWSLVVELQTKAHEPLEWIGTVKFLVPDAPAQLLYPGSRFELFEGHRAVAKGEVLGNSQDFLTN